MKRKKQEYFASKCKDEVAYKTASEMVKHYEGKGYAALREKDVPLSHIYFQQAEHYKKLIDKVN